MTNLKEFFTIGKFLSKAYRCEKKLKKLIPNKHVCGIVMFMLLPLWIGILLISLCYSICRLIHEMLNKVHYKYQIAIVAFAKNESDYIREWVLFHKLVGIEHIFLYDNDSSDGMREKIEKEIKQEFVSCVPIHGYKRQLDAYNHALKYYGKECKYIAFIDCDEFLMPVMQDQNVVCFLDNLFQGHPMAGGCAVNWCMYGSSGHLIKPEGLLIDNFLYRAVLPDGRGNECIKTIVRPSYVQEYCHTHYPCFKFGGYNIDTCGRIVTEWSNRINQYYGLRINHYFVKSKAQWEQRRALGKSDHNKGEDLRTIEEFYQHDNNDVLDIIATRYSSKIKQCVDYEE